MWVGIVIAILNLLSNLPELIEKFKEIFDGFKRVPRMKVVYEAKKLAKACEEKAKAHATLSPEPCPIDGFLDDLRKRYP
jgi:hypothetical protein